MQLADLHRLDKEELFCAVTSWQRAREMERLLIVTTRGFARAYPLHILRESIEAPVPLRLDNPLPGLPVALFGARNEDEFLIITRSARGVRWTVRGLDSGGTQVINCGKDDQAATALTAKPGEEIVLMTEDGYGRRLHADWLPIPERPNQKARSLISRRSNLAGAGKNPVLAITTQRILPVLTDSLLLTDSTKTEQAIPLTTDESVQTLFCRSD